MRSSLRNPLRIAAGIIGVGCLAMWGDRPARVPAPKALSPVAAPVVSPFLAQLGQPDTAGSSFAGAPESGESPTNSTERPTLILQTGIEGKITAEAWSPNRDCVAFAADDGTVTLVDPKTGEIERTVQGALGSANAVEFSRDGKEFVTAGGSASHWISGFGYGGQARIWDRATGRLLVNLSDLGQPVSCVHFSPDGHSLGILVSGLGSFDFDLGTVQVWNPKFGVRSLSNWDDDASDMGFSPDGKLFGFWSSHIGNLGTAEISLPTPRLFDAVNFTPYRPAPTSDHDAQAQWDVHCHTPSGQVHPPSETRALRHKLAPPLPSIDAFDIGADGTLAVASGPSGIDSTRDLTLWNLRTGRLTDTFLIAGGSFDVNTGLFRAHHRHDVLMLGHGIPPLRGQIGNDFTVGPDVVEVGDPGTELIGNVSTALCQSLQSPRPLTAFAYNPEGIELVTACDDGIIRIWDANGYKLLASLQILGKSRTKAGSLATDWITTTPDGCYAGSPGVEKYIRWNVNGQLYPAAVFRDRYYRPDLVRNALTFRQAWREIQAQREAAIEKAAAYPTSEPGTNFTFAS